MNIDWDKHCDYVNFMRENYHKRALITQQYDIEMEENELRLLDEFVPEELV